MTSETRLLRPGLVVVLASACASQPPRADLPLEARVWSLRGSARVTAGPTPSLSLEYCCSRWGAASATLNAPGPRARLRLEYRADCEDGSYIAVDDGQGEPKPLQLPLFAAKALHERCPFRRALKGAAVLELHAVGGLGCCGKTEVTRISVEPMAPSPGWDAERCERLYVEAEEAWRGGSEPLRRFILGLAHKVR